MKKPLQAGAFLMPSVATVLALYVFAESQRAVKVGVILAGTAVGLLLLWLSSRTA